MARPWEYADGVFGTRAKINEFLAGRLGLNELYRLLQRASLRDAQDRLLREALATLDEATSVGAPAEAVRHELGKLVAAHDAPAMKAREGALVWANSFTAGPQSPAGWGLEVGESEFTAG